MSFLTDWSLIGPFTVKGIIACVLVAVLGYAVTQIHAFHEPEDDA